MLPTFTGLSFSSLSRWLLFDIPHNFRYEDALNTKVVEAMQSALQVESDPCAVAAYMTFMKMQIETNPCPDIHHIADDVIDVTELDHRFQFIAKTALSCAAFILRRCLFVACYFVMFSYIVCCCCLTAVLQALFFIYQCPIHLFLLHPCALMTSYDVLLMTFPRLIHRRVFSQLTYYFNDDENRREFSISKQMMYLLRAICFKSVTFRTFLQATITIKHSRSDKPITCESIKNHTK